jgi:DNA-binding MarR family transcriptional regulator
MSQLMAEAPGDVATRVLAAFHTVLRRIRTPAADPLDKASLIVLGRVAEAGNLRLSDLAADVGLDVSTVSRHVRELVDAGLVVKAEDTLDRRACRLSITRPGTTLVARARQVRAAVVREALESWSDDDRRTLATLLERLAGDLGSIDRARSEPGKGTA